MALWLPNVGQFNAVERANVGPESSWARWHRPAFGLASFLATCTPRRLGVTARHALRSPGRPSSGDKVTFSLPLILRTSSSSRRAYP